MALDAKIPEGDLEHKWRDYKSHVKLVNPSNKRKLEVIVIGTGLAGALPQLPWASLVIR